MRTIPYIAGRKIMTLHIDSSGIAREKWLDFVEGSLREDGNELAIGKWKTDGWSQLDVEKILDIMAEAGLATPRKNGIKCTYSLSSPTVGQVMRRLENFF